MWCGRSMRNKRSCISKYRAKSSEQTDIINDVKEAEGMSKNNAACFSPRNFSELNEAQSVSCHNEGYVWLYPELYGDAGGRSIMGDVEDLKGTLYGNQMASFSKNVEALWVLKG